MIFQVSEKILFIKKVALKNNDEDNDLYSVRVYKFNENCGLYVVFATETEDAEDLILI